MPIINLIRRPCNKNLPPRTNSSTDMEKFVRQSGQHLYRYIKKFTNKYKLHCQINTISQLHAYNVQMSKKDDER